MCVWYLAMNLSTNASIKFNLIADQIWLTVNESSRVATLHFNIQKSRNAISLRVAEELFALGEILMGKRTEHPLSSLIKSEKLLVLVLRSHCENVFLSGGDLKELSSVSVEQGEVFTNQMRTFTQAIRQGALVSVVLLNGLAAGGGAEIALAADLRISISKSAQIHFAQTLWGVPAGWGMMSDLTSKNIFSSERRRGIAMASQELLDLESLAHHRLLDARFEVSKQPLEDSFIWIEHFAERLASCPDQLRTQLIHERPKLQADKLSEFDKNLFSEYWLQDEHQQRLNSFWKKRAQSPKEE